MEQLSPTSIAAGLGTRWLAQRIIHYERIGSTNDEARRLALEGTPEGTLVIAEEQTAGRGRLGRRWVAAPGEALLFSLVFYPPLPPQDAYQVTMLLSVACVEAIAAETRMQPAIKWPNDLLLGRRKLAGILSEMCRLDDGIYVVAGIGLNVNVDFSAWPDLAGQATSLAEAFGRPLPRLPLLQEILRRIEARYDRLRAGELPHADWVEHLATLGQMVRVTTHQGVIEGLARSADPDGALVLELADGTTQRILVGDVERLR
ncbi:MAG TPA: biotin--[acetyl-CoA-carboxylase] ligase [Anaerolineae bacterium]|nr:biotin--[acetyl-CoA-carboxylase] ligase [Anaerolineae bacterium]HOQ98279.1 biotin--[acetyl-CoA-carboxylase] ligase [Anaerolineae bacterium]HPL27616.1 biotin--[acetyl-CoA-carboxylase] ligase [Anaerolineae bacterium]